MYLVLGKGTTSLFTESLREKFPLVFFATNIIVPKSLEYIFIEFGFSTFIVKSITYVTGCISWSKGVFFFPCEVFIISSVIFVEVQQVFRQSLNRWKILHTYKRARRDNLWCVEISCQFYRHWISIKCTPKFLSNVIRTHAVFKCHIKSIWAENIVEIALLRAVIVFAKFFSNSGHIYQL